MYQLLPPLSQDEYHRLEASILHENTCSIVVDENDNILDGHHRYEIATKHNISIDKIVKVFETEIEKKCYVLRVNDARRQMSNEQRVEIRRTQIELAKQLNKQGYTQEGIGGMLGVAQNTISTWLNGKIISSIKGDTTNIDNHQYVDTRQKIGQKEKEAIIQQLDNGFTQEQVSANFKITQPRVSQIKKKHEQKKQKTKERASEVKASNDNILLGTLQELGRDVADNSIDLIFTDPPYGKEAIKEYEALGEFAARTLKPGASLLVYSGQSVLPEVFTVMTKHLNYWWTICMEHTGQNQRLAGKFVYVEWKPIIWFVKGNRRDTHFVRDFIKSEQDKNHHEWGQGLTEVLYYIGQLTKPEELVCDPFLGGGTTIIAAQKLNRRYLGFEKNTETYKRLTGES